MEEEIKNLQMQITGLKIENERHNNELIMINKRITRLQDQKANDNIKQ